MCYRRAVMHVCSVRSHHSCTAPAKSSPMLHFTLVIRQVAYLLIVLSARFTRIKPLQSKCVKLSAANTSRRESEHLYPGTCQVGPGLSVLAVLPSQSWLINRPLSCCFLAKMEELCSWVVDPADVCGAAGHSSPQSRSICEHQSFTQKGFLGRVRGPLNPTVRSPETVKPLVVRFLHEEWKFM